MKEAAKMWIFRTAMLALLAVYIIPVLWVFRTAFMPKQLAIDLAAVGPFNLDNFRSVFEAAPFNIYYVNTIVIILSIFSIQIFTVTLSAYAFARMQFIGKGILFVLFLLQIMITPDILMLPNYSFLARLDLIDTRLGIMIPYFASSFGIFLMRQAFKQIPFELEEAARLEGAGTWRVIWTIYAPLSKAYYAAFGMISVSYHWNNFLWPLVVTNSVEKRTLSVGLAIFAQSYETGAQWGEVCAATSAVIAPLLLAFFIFQKQIMESFAHSGIK